MKKCPYCGAPIEDKCDTMCAYCGSPFSKGDSAEAQYTHQEYSQQHTANQYAQHTSQQYNTQQPMQAQSMDERLRQAMERYNNPQRNELSNKASTAKIVAVISLFFCSTFVVAIIALVMANAVLKDPGADDTAVSNAKSAKTIAIVSICIGLFLCISQLSLLNIMFSA